MSYNVSKASLQRAISHLENFGDTDIFPRLPELHFLVDEVDSVIEELIKLDLNNYMPGSAMESLAPKSRYGFRIAHQLSPIDTVLLLACVIEIGHEIEKMRQDPEVAFSYRFIKDSDDSIFLKEHSYRDWLQMQKITANNSEEISHVVYTDISDFYHRISYHRLENYLDECAPKHGASKFIKKYIKEIRAKQSFGLPVGGSAARLLAELALCDTDQLLIDNNILFTRFVDDFRIFIRNGEDGYEILALLAEHLAVNEGLSLNSSKTRVLEIDNFLAELDELLTDVANDAQNDALETLTANLYFDDEPDPDDFAKLSNLNLLSMLDEEISKDYWDTGKIKIIFRALRIIKDTESISFIHSNFNRLIIFGKDLVLLMEEIEKEVPKCFSTLLDHIINSILKPPASSVVLIQCWLLELFVRGVVDIPLSKLKRLENLRSTLLRRQILLIRGRKADKNFFRMHKTKFDQFPSFEQTCLVWGASCLPEDEFQIWLTTIKKKFKMPCAELYCEWIKKNKGGIYGEIS